MSGSRECLKLRVGGYLAVILHNATGGHYIGVFTRIFEARCRTRERDVLLLSHKLSAVWAVFLVLADLSVRSNLKFTTLVILLWCIFPQQYRIQMDIHNQELLGSQLLVVTNNTYMTAEDKDTRRRNVKPNCWAQKFLIYFYGYYAYVYCASSHNQCFRIRRHIE